MAVFPAPMVLAELAFQPTAVLSYPEVLFCMAAVPKAELVLP